MIEENTTNHFLDPSSLRINVNCIPTLCTTENSCATFLDFWIFRSHLQN
jgi:hypothetical protein